MITPTRLEALEQAVSAAGGQSQFARSLGTNQPTVWRWLHQSKQLPAEYVLKAESLFGVSRHALRPDIYPAEVASARFLGVDRGGMDRFVGVDRGAGRSALGKAA